MHLMLIKISRVNGKYCNLTKGTDTYPFTVKHFCLAIIIYKRAKVVL